MTLQNSVTNTQKILVGICSCGAYGARRQAVRQTWFSRSFQHVQCEFFVGKEACASGEPDLIVVDAEDDYDHLPKKVLAYFRRALETSEFDWLFKCDDDTYVALDRLHALLQPGYDLIGSRCVTRRGAPSGGAGYFLSRRMVEMLVNDSRLALTGPEDIIIGEAVTRLGGRSLADDRLGLKNIPYPRSCNDLATAHWCSPQHLTAIDSILHSTPVADTLIAHSHWNDRVHFYESGWFAREATGCCGTWSREQEDRLLLKWLDWPEERFIPDSPPNGHSIASRYVRAGCKIETVTVDLMGGLGNQMFQYAHGFALSKRLGAKLRLRWSGGPRHFALDLFGLRVDGDPPVQHTFFKQEGNWKEGQEWPSWEAARRCLSPHLMISGYFQNEKFFRGAEAELRSIFSLQPSLPPEVGNRTPVCVQVRRGDFVGHRLHDICGIDYFQTGIQLLRALVPNPVFLVLSDDPAWCKTAFAEQSDTMILPPQSDIEAMCTMAACKTFLISNSTFGWWGAWLANASAVIAPRTFLVGKAWDICPENWILLPSILPRDQTIAQQDKQPNHT